MRRNWARTDLSCGTSIPLISTHKDSHAAYCVGMYRNATRLRSIGAFRFV